LKVSAGEALRVILDANIWSYIGEQEVADQFVDWRHSSGFQIVVPPSVLLEVLRTPIRDLRKKIVNAVTLPGMQHPKTEVHAEGLDFVAAVRRYRPRWLKAIPHTDRVPVHEKFWRRQVWDLARKDPDNLAAQWDTLLSGHSDYILKTQRRNKEAARAAGATINVGDAVVDIEGSTIPSLRLGWVGGQIDAWRVEGALRFWHELTGLDFPGLPRADGTYEDWIGPWVALGRMASDRADYNRFWYYDVTGFELPRTWLSWAILVAQMSTKLGSGNPVDVQHAMYLFDADVFVTGDVRLGRILTDLRRLSPVPFASVIVIKGEPDVIEALHTALPNQNVIS
jgi:hypothetical protein